MSILSQEQLDKLDNTNRRKFSTINRIIIHCSDSDNPQVTATTVDTWHTVHNLWIGIGYNYFIDSNGNIEIGRLLRHIGSHVKGHNKDSIGICLNGKRRFSKEQFRSLNRLLRKLCKKFDIPYTEIYPHKKFNRNKTCPNFDIYKHTVAEKKKPS